jgi:hypothetical protein
MGFQIRDLRKKTAKLLVSVAEWQKQSCTAAGNMQHRLILDTP